MPLSSSFLFKELSESQLQRVTAVAKEIQILKDQWLFQEGKTADCVYVLKKGAVELLTRVNGKYELPVKIIRSKGGCFGTPALIPPYEYSLSSRCAEDTALLEIRRDDLEKLNIADPALGCAIMKNLAQHLLERLKENRREIKIHFKTLFGSMHT
jgi:CRP/FNR family transcriptional regulator, cyclic AMP receptor protein